MVLVACRTIIFLKKGILGDHFKINDCFETIDQEEQPVEIAIPMVSFCAIDISDIQMARLAHVSDTLLT